MNSVKFLCLILIIVFSNLSWSQSRPQLEQFAILMQSVAENDLDKFYMNSTTEFKKGIDHKAFKMLVYQYGPGLKRGYSAEYLTDLTQNGFDVTVWKVSFEGETEQLLVKVVLDEERITGLWFH